MPDGRAVTRYVLTNRAGTRVELLDRGATIVRIALKGRTDVVVGPDPAGLLASERRYGGIVGRYAGRLRGHVDIDGRRHPLATNAAGTTLHGGDPGFDRVLWSARPFTSTRESGVVFTHVSRDGDQHFPGTLTVSARYALAQASDTLTLDITAVADRPTVANLTNHAYFDLSGGTGLACQTLAVDTVARVAVDARKLPTGELPRTAPFDRPLRDVVGKGGMDEMLVLGRTRTVRLVDHASGRQLILTTDQAGLQVYTGGGFDGTDRSRSGHPIARFAGVALEPGNFPDAPAMPHFPSARVTPDKPYRWHARWRFEDGRAGTCP